MTSCKELAPLSEVVGTATWGTLLRSTPVRNGGRASTEPVWRGLVTLTQGGCAVKKVGLTPLLKGGGVGPPLELTGLAPLIKDCCTGTKSYPAGLAPLLKNPCTGTRLDPGGLAPLVKDDGAGPPLGLTELTLLIKDDCTGTRSDPEGLAPLLKDPWTDTR